MTIVPPGCAGHDTQETNTQYEIALETLRAEAVDLKSKCRQLESETTFSEVFDKYEHEIDDLTSSCRAYRDEIARLRTTIADISNATQREESDDGADDARVLQLRRLLRKATSESEKSLETIENLRKQNRHYEFHKKGHEEAFKRISAIQKQLNRKQKECVEVNLMLAERETQIGRLKADIDRSVDAEARSERGHGEHSHAQEGGDPPHEAPDDEASDVDGVQESPRMWNTLVAMRRARACEAVAA